jgi:amino-acid N-acetyltransferase
MTIQLRSAGAADAAAIHALVASNVQEGHLLPRAVDEIEQHAARFLVAEAEGRIIGCAELAPLSESVAEVRSLVVDEACRGQRAGTALVTAVADRAREQGFSTLCAFTHQPAHFVHLGFSIVPHAWIPEKIAHDCAGCALFRRCGQYAVSQPLRRGALVRTFEATSAPRVMPRPRASVERLRLEDDDVLQPARERIPA